MGNTIKTMKKVSYDHVRTNIVNNSNYILINTLPDIDQSCLIMNTISSQDEINIINKLIKEKRQKNTTVCIYGKNYSDEKIITQYNKLKSLGFSKLEIYPGGIFEWLCLHEIYGYEHFPITSTTVIDILKYRPDFSK